MALHNLDYPSGSIEENMAIRALNHQRECDYLKTVAIATASLNNVDAKQVQRALKNLLEHMMPEEKERAALMEKDIIKNLEAEIKKGPIRMMPIGLSSNNKTRRRVNNK